MKTIEEIWTEKELIGKFDLAQKENRSRQVSHWIRKGLRHVNLSGKRYFREEDVVKFFEGLFE